MFNFDVKAVVNQIATPGNQRRSLLGMLDTDSQSLARWLVKNGVAVWHKDSCPCCQGSWTLYLK